MWASEGSAVALSVQLHLSVDLSVTALAALILLAHILTIIPIIKPRREFQCCIEHISSTFILLDQGSGPVWRRAGPRSLHPRLTRPGHFSLCSHPFLSPLSHFPSLGVFVFVSDPSSCRGGELLRLAEVIFLRYQCNVDIVTQGDNKPHLCHESLKFYGNSWILMWSSVQCIFFLNHPSNVTPFILRPELFHHVHIMLAS